MASVLGLGGPFIRVSDPKGLAAWYEENLGVSFSGGTYAVLPLGDKGFNILTFFPKDSKYFAPGTKDVMINLRVDNLDEFLEQLKSKGIKLEGEPMSEEYGKFAWIVDSEGHKIELWEPPV